MVPRSPLVVVALLAAGCAAAPPADPNAGRPPSPAPPSAAPSAATGATTDRPVDEPQPAASGVKPPRTGAGVDLVHVLCTLDVRHKPHRAHCAEAAPDARRPPMLAACKDLTRRAATPGLMQELSRAWEAAGPRVGRGGAPLRAGAGIITPSGIPRADSVAGRPAVMVVDMLLLGMRHSRYRAAGCDDVPAHTGCDPVAVGEGALVPGEARGRVQMVSTGFGGVGRCDRP